MKRMQICEIEMSEATEVFSDNSIRSAYPCEVSCNNGKLEMYGLTKREYFAGLAMQGMLANLNGALLSGGTKTLHPNHIAQMSVIHADAVLKELDKK